MVMQLRHWPHQNGQINKLAPTTTTTTTKTNPCRDGWRNRLAGERTAVVNQEEEETIKSARSKSKQTPQTSLSHAAAVARASFSATMSLSFEHIIFALLLALCACQLTLAEPHREQQHQHQQQQQVGDGLEPQIDAHSKPESAAVVPGRRRQSPLVPVNPELLNGSFILDQRQTHRPPTPVATRAPKQVEHSSSASLLPVVDHQQAEQQQRNQQTMMTTTMPSAPINEARTRGQAMKLFKRRRKANRVVANNNSNDGIERSEVMQPNDKNGDSNSISSRSSSNNNNNEDDKLGSQANQINGGDDRRIESLLVRQLSDLVMNNEPEMIRLKLTNAQIGDQLKEETRRLTGSRSFPAIRLTITNDNGPEGLADQPAEATMLLVTTSTMTPTTTGNNAPLVVDEDDAMLLDVGGSSAAAADDEDDDEDDDDDEMMPPDEMLEERIEPGLTHRGPDSLRARLEQSSTAPPASGPRSHRRRMAEESNSRPTTTTTMTKASTSNSNNENSTSSGSASASSGPSWLWDWITRSIGRQQQQQLLQPRVAGSESSSSSGAELFGASTNLSLEPAASQSEIDVLAQQQQQEQEQLADQTVPVACPSSDYEDQVNSIQVDAIMNEYEAANGGNGTGDEPLAGAGGGNQSSTMGTTATSSSNQLQYIQSQQCARTNEVIIQVITTIVTPILFTIIIIVGLLGNIIVGLVIWEDKNSERGEWSPANLLILDLSIADLFFIIFCIPFTGWDYAVGHWVFGRIWCKLNQYLIITCAIGSIYTLVLMSFDRFLAIVYPIESLSYRTSDNIMGAIIFKWVVILIGALPTIQMHDLVVSSISHDQYNCRFLRQDYDPLTFQITFFILSYFLPLVLIFFLYLRLLKRLWCGEHPRGHKESAKKLESKKKVTRTVAWIVCVFAICWFPIQIMLILMRLKSHNITPTYVAIQVIAHTLGYMNSCVNPIIYAFTTESFYQSLKRSRFGGRCLALFCCGQYSSNQLNNNNNTTNNNNNNNGLNNGHSTNGLSNSFGHQQQHQSTTTTVVIHSVGGVRQTPGGSRNSLQFMASNTSGVGGGAGGGLQSGFSHAAGPISQRANKSLGNIFASRPLQETCDGGGGTSNGDSSSLFPTPAPGQSVMRRVGQDSAADASSKPPDPAPQNCQNNPQQAQKPRQLALEPRDRPQMSKLSPGNVRHHNNQQQQQQVHQHQQHQQLQQLPISLSSSVNQLTAQGQGRPVEQKKATSSSDLIPRQPTATERVFQSLGQQPQQQQQQPQREQQQPKQQQHQQAKEQQPELEGDPLVER
uniref:Allatostatin-A receptor n=1 Tax=Aceria tosichella TaxID=561515 RepID=A0A6G1SF41_9ACAR